MEKFQSFQTFQTLCQVGIVVFSIFAILCGYGSYHFGILKETIAKKDSSIKQTSSYHISGDYIQGNKVQNLNSSNKKNEKQKTEIINAPSAIIITKNQKGGNNVVNFNGSKLNPANKDMKPIFEPKGYYGDNLLNENITLISKNINYSFAVNIPDNSKIKIKISKLDEDKKALWFTRVDTEKSWRHTIYKDGEQEYDLDDPFGDQLMLFSDPGLVLIKIYFNDEFIGEKRIKCE